MTTTPTGPLPVPEPHRDAVDVRALTMAALDAVQPTWRATGGEPDADDIAFVAAALAASGMPGEVVSADAVRLATAARDMALTSTLTEGDSEALLRYAQQAISMWAADDAARAEVERLRARVGDLMAARVFCPTCGGAGYLAEDDETETPERPCPEPWCEAVALTQDGVDTLAAERDAARAEVAALTERIEALRTPVDADEASAVLGRQASLAEVAAINTWRVWFLTGEAALTALSPAEAGHSITGFDGRDYACRCGWNGPDGDAHLTAEAGQGEGRAEFPGGDPKACGCGNPDAHRAHPAPPSDDLREKIVNALVMSPLSDTAGTDMAPFYRAADAVLAVLAGQEAAK